MQASEKLQIIGEIQFQEYAKIKSNKNISKRKIKSTFYKKNHAKSLDLMHFLKDKKSKGGIQKKSKTHKKILVNLAAGSDFKRKNKKISTLKKKILNSRTRRNVFNICANNKLKEIFKTQPLLYQVNQNFHDHNYHHQNNDHEEQWEDHVIDDADNNNDEHVNADDDEINKLVEAATDLTINATNLHSRRYRNYCDNLTNDALESSAKNLLMDLQRFQKRAAHKNAVRAHAHRRYVLGFREVQNMLLTNKVKLVVIATDCENCPQPGGLNDIINGIKIQCANKCLPLAFVLQRRQLARCFQIKGQVCCLALLDISGAEKHFQDLLATLECAKHQYAAINK